MLGGYLNERAAVRLYAPILTKTSFFEVGKQAQVQIADKLVSMGFLRAAPAMGQ
jgi:hypothetical protein